MKAPSGQYSRALARALVRSAAMNRSSSAHRNPASRMYDEAGRLLGEYDIDGKAKQETLWFNDLPVAVIK